MIEDLIKCLKLEPPEPEPPKIPEEHKRDRRKSAAILSGWCQRWEQWEAERLRDLRWLGRSGSIVWFEVAGLDREAVISKLEAQGLLYDAASRFPPNFYEEYRKGSRDR